MGYLLRGAKKVEKVPVRRCSGAAAGCIGGRMLVRRIDRWIVQTVCEQAERVINLAIGQFLCGDNKQTCGKTRMDGV